MQLKALAGLTAALLLTTSASAAFAEELVIYHSWSTPSEMAALNVLKDGLAAKGVGWTEIAIPHDTGSTVSVVNLVTGGNPPNVFMNSNPGIIRDLQAQGLIMDLTELFEKNGVTANLPETVLKAATVDGRIMKAPAGVHIDGMVYYNMAVAEAAGVDPAAWTSLDAMWADFDKITAAGYQPLAVGSQNFQASYLFQALVAAVSGPDVYNRFYGPEVDPTVFDDPAFRQAIEWERKFSEQVDAGSENRAWNETTNLVITGKALMQIHGDWMKGEWRNAGKTAGTDFGCVNIPGTKAVVVTVDAWNFLDGPSVTPEKRAAEEQFALLDTSPEATAAFAAKKGSTPVRLDAPTEGLDQCNVLVLDSLKQDGMSVQNPYNIADQDWQSTIADIIFEFWGNPDKTADDVIADLKEQYEVILG